MLRIGTVWGLVVMLTLGGCASVKTRKIDSNGQPTGPNGIRFYLPRPYVVVTEPFVIGSDVYLLRGHLTPDSQHVVIDAADPEIDGVLKSYLLADPKREVRIPAASIKLLPSNQDARWSPQATESEAAEEGEPERSASSEAGDEGGKQPDESKPDDPTKPGDPTKPDKAADTPGEAEAPSTGVIGTKVENDPNTFSITPLKRYFDIAWLPDFDEQYVVTGKAGLGNASIGVRLGQGWSLQGLETTADNSKMTDTLTALWGDAIKSLYALAKSKYALPAAFLGGAQAQTEGQPTLATATGGIPVTIKLTIARVAAPGLYPILKPKELACLTGSDGKDALTCLPVADYKSQQNVVLPVPPLTNVAFNVYRLIVLEAARPDGDSITAIQRYFDPAPGTTKPTLNNSDTQKPIDQDVLDEVRDAVNAVQKTSVNRWEIVSIAEAGDRIRAVVKKVGNPNATQRQLLATSIAGEFGQRGVARSASEIDVKEESN